MKEVEVDYIVKRVRLVLDELGINDSEFIEDKDNSELDNVIYGKVEESVKEIHLNAPIWLIDGIDLHLSLTGSSLIKKSDLPNDFLRLVSLLMDGWIKPCNKAIYEDNPEYIKQADKYACGTWESPVCAIVKDTGKQVLEIYSTKEISSAVKHSIYLPIPKIEDNSDKIKVIKICEKLEDAIVYMIAGLVLITYKDEHSGNLINISKSMMQ